MKARDEILGRIRHSLQDVQEPDPTRDVPVERSDLRAAPPADLLGLFAERCEDYTVTLRRCVAKAVPEVMVDLLGEAGVRSVVVPPGIDSSWRQAISAAGMTLVEDDPPLSRAALDGIDAVVTAAAVAIAETGTVVLDHGADQGRRALTLMPDTHVVVVQDDQVVPGVAEAMARLAAASAPGDVQTWISGPSATSDIELSRVEGVHGPRHLLVIVADSGSRPEPENR